MEEFGSAIDVEERISNERKTEKDRKSLTIASETNRDYLTTIEAISVAGDVSSHRIPIPIGITRHSPGIPSERGTSAQSGSNNYYQLQSHSIPAMGISLSDSWPRSELTPWSSGNRLSQLKWLKRLLSRQISS